MSSGTALCINSVKFTLQLKWVTNNELLCVVRSLATFCATVVVKRTPKISLRGLGWLQTILHWYAVCKSTLRVFLLLPQELASTDHTGIAKVSALWNDQNHLMLSAANIFVVHHPELKSSGWRLRVVHTGEVVVTCQDYPFVWAMRLGQACL